MKDAAPMYGLTAPSDWIVRWSHLLAPEAVEAAGAFGRAVMADIESGPWPV